MRPYVMLSLIVAFFCFSYGTSLAEPTAPREEVGVRALMKSPGNYPGEIVVTGVVSQVVGEASVIGLIDVQEFKDCNTVSCAKLILPVRWEGVMPEVGQQLSATGAISQEGRRYLFVATDLQVAPPN